MIGRPGSARGRSGITLTEILISILIMGVGMISLATLFPLGLTRLRVAARMNRSALYSETIASEVPSRNLLSATSFTTTWYGTYVLGSNPYNPLTSDPLNPLNASASQGQVGGTPPPLNNAGANQVAAFATGPGSPFCYDPLWRQLTNTPPFSGSGANMVSNDARFANGEGVVRTDPDGNPPSAHGLQRITNLPAGGNWPPFATPNPATTAGQLQLASWNSLVGNIFASQDDPVFQTFSANPNITQGKGSPLVADLSSGGPQNDWSYTWMFTGRQSDLSNPAYFDGDIVVFQNRPFGFEALNNAPFSNAFTPAKVATGEVVVEAIWGYAAPRASQVTNTKYYYDFSPTSRTVLLRWPASLPDPHAGVGGWIADVTYERVPATWNTRFGPGAPTPFTAAYQGQRCLWYRVAKKTAAEPEAGGNQFGTSGSYRQMVVTTATPLRAKTLLITPAPAGSASFGPVNVNAALVAPSVVNVYSQVFYSR